MMDGRDPGEVPGGAVLVFSDPEFSGRVAPEASAQGISVICTDQAETAIRWLITREIGAVVLDLGFGNRAVSQVLKVLGSTDELSRIPFIMIADISDAQLVEEAVLHGAASFLIKPFEVRELLDHLHSAISPAPTAGLFPEPAAGDEDDDPFAEFVFDLELDDSALVDHKTIPLRREEVDRYVQAVRQRREADAGASPGEEPEEELTAEDLEQTRKITRLRWLAAVPRVKPEVSVETIDPPLDARELELLQRIDGQTRIAQLERDSTMSSAAVSDVIARLLRRNVISLIRR